MYFPAVVSAFFLSLLISASPTPSDSLHESSKRFSESEPWVLSDIYVYTAKKGTNAASYIDFKFTDSNKGIKLKTHCRRSVLPNDKPPTVNNPKVYYPCANNTVRFIYNEGRFDIARSYLDPSVGPPGMDIVTAFGHKRALFKADRDSCGLLARSDKVKVPITSMIA